MGGIAHPLKWLCWSIVHSGRWVVGSESTTFHHVPIGGSLWNLHSICVLVISCNMQKVKVIGQKVKGHGSKNRSNFDIFGFKKKLRSHRLSFKAENFFMGPLSRYKKTQEIKFWIFLLFFEKLSKNSQKWRFSALMSKSVNFLIVLSTIEG